MALHMGLQKALGLNLQGIFVEGDTLCVIHWAAGSCFALWTMTNIMEEVLDLARQLNASFHHVKQVANEVADDLAKEGGSRQRYVIL